MFTGLNALNFSSFLFQRIVVDPSMHWVTFHGSHFSTQNTPMRSPRHSICGLEKQLAGKCCHSQVPISWGRGGRVCNAMPYLSHPNLNLGPMMWEVNNGIRRRFCVRSAAFISSSKKKGIIALLYFGASHFSRNCKVVEAHFLEVICFRCKFLYLQT